jgi:pilus assembly protein CpaF
MTGFEMILPFLRPIQTHILDPDVSEIMVNGPEKVFVERGGYLEQIQGVTLNEKSLMVAVKNIARWLDDDISEEKPILDSRLPDDSRVAAVIPPCSLNGVTLTIRKFNARHFGIEDLIRVGTITEDLGIQFADAVRSRKNVLISGGTGTGKTTLLNILANFIPNGERVLVIEDTAEIQIRTPNLVHFEARQAQNGLPAVTNPLAAESHPPAPARPNLARRDSGRRGLRFAPTPKHGSFGHPLDGPRKLGASSPKSLHNVRPAERDGAA